MKLGNRILLFSLTILLVGSTTSAQLATPDPSLSTAVNIGVSQALMVPGEGQEILEIVVTLVDATGAPIAGYPKEDIRFESVIPGELIFCEGRDHALVDTDAMGVTRILTTFSGGGCTQSGVKVVVGGVTLAGTPLSIDVASPDMNGDLLVDFRDFVEFSPAFGGAYSSCADLNFNGIVNIDDALALYDYLCRTCPSGTPISNTTMAGEIGVFFDTAGTQTGIQGLNPGDNFEFHVVAFSAPGGIAGFQFGVTVDDANVTVSGYSTSPGLDIGDVHLNPMIGLYNGVEQISSPTLLASFQATLTGPVTDSPICLGPPGINQCGSEPSGPAYIRYSDGEWRQFNQAYEGCAYINGYGPVATEATSWGSLKAIFRD